MMDVSKGRYWQKPWSLVSGCTPCSPGCDHCWSAGMTYRYFKSDGGASLAVVNPDHPDGKTPPFFTGRIITHPERLTIPLRRRKPTVYAVWNDLFHVDVKDAFCDQAYAVMALCKQHTFLVLTKRHGNIGRYWMQGRVDLGTAWWEARRYRNHGETISAADCGRWPTTGFPNVWHGLTVCDQAEADAKIPVFLRVPGRKFLSIEPCLGEIDLFEALGGFDQGLMIGPHIDAVILGGETGNGARPMHPDWVRSVRDQCAAAGVAFFFKGWGEWRPESQFGQHVPSLRLLADHAKKRFHQWSDGSRSYRLNRAAAGRLLDGRTHDELPWVEL